MINRRAEEIEILAQCLRLITEAAHNGTAGADQRARMVRLTDIAEHITGALREILSVPEPAPFSKPLPRNTMRSRH